ncbi:GNAT family N-acetyltransferase [Paenibacillus dendritiformis]|uniref:GNAT family N-acetyltransferase n=1 Tax=Paenibacillus dendritiformis TaxID=130049 RepID=UPI001F2F3B11|nr:GNAT family N-acetyltransferase [Paenibacillus dendritiformis]
MLIIQHQLLDDYTIQRAERKHFDELLNLFLEAAAWLRRNGIRQWGHFLDGYGRDDVMISINSGSAFVIEKEGNVIGTVSVLLEPEAWDRHIWQTERLDDSIFIHRLALSRSHAGRNLGKEILRWIEQGLQIPDHMKYIKLDCVGDNEKLNHYYRANGFQYAGSTDGHSKYVKELQGKH